MVYHVVRRGRFEIAVDLSEQDRTGTCRAREHAVHHEKLLFAVCGEKYLCNDTIVPIGYEESRNGENDHNTPVAFQHAEADRRDSRNDHDVKEEIADACHQKVVDIIPVRQRSFFQKLQYLLDQHGTKNADQEVEAVNDGSHSGKQRAEPENDQIGEQIGDHDECDLDGHFVDAALHGDLVCGLDIGERDISVL